MGSGWARAFRDGFGLARAFRDGFEPGSYLDIEKLSSFNRARRRSNWTDLKQ